MDYNVGINVGYVGYNYKLGDFVFNLNFSAYLSIEQENDPISGVSGSGLLISARIATI